jgi:hypothetical protein
MVVLTLTQSLFSMANNIETVFDLSRQVASTTPKKEDTPKKAVMLQIIAKAVTDPEPDDPLVKLSDPYVYLRFSLQKTKLTCTNFFQAEARDA